MKSPKSLLSQLLASLPKLSAILFVFSTSLIQLAYSQSFCAPGFFGPDGSFDCEAASPGYFVPNAGATSPTITPAGTFTSEAGSITPILAAPGSFVALEGQTSAELAQPGYFVPNSGASFETISPVGHYVAGHGGTQAIPAAPGSFVALEGQTFAELAQPGYFVPNSGASFETIAPVGHYVADQGGTQAIPAAPGFYAPEEGATFTFSCPQDSTSFGAAPACRSGFISMNNPDTIGPDFDSNYGVGGQINLGALETNTAGAFELDIMNIANSLGYTDDLTSLTLIDIDLSGINANLFSLDGFIPSTVLGEQESANFSVLFMSMIETSFNVNLTFSTDQFATFGGIGQNFEYNILGRFYNGQVVVSSPAVSVLTLLLLCVMMGRRAVRIAKEFV